MCESIVFNLLRSSLIHKAPFPFTVLLEGEQSRIFGNLYNLACCILTTIENTSTKFLFRVDLRFYLHFLGNSDYEVSFLVHPASIQLFRIFSTFAHCVFLTLVIESLNSFLLPSNTRVGLIFKIKIKHIHRWVPP